MKWYCGARRKCMDLEVSLDVLVAGEDFASCHHRVSRFFDRTMLLRFDEVRIDEKESINAADQAFWERLDEGISANRKTIGELAANLRQEGFGSFEKLQSLEKGYLTKIFHTIAHLLDGFIGIDSRFYSLEEDSHSISNALRKQITAEPQRFWVIRVVGKIGTADQDPLDALRTFEMKKQDS
jgi:hypothetical protein